MAISPKTLLFILACVLTILHYLLVFLSNKMEINEKYVNGSYELLKYVIAAWIGSIIGGVEL